jgi:hypothetical protein
LSLTRQSTSSYLRNLPELFHPAEDDGGGDNQQIQRIDAGDPNALAQEAEMLRIGAGSDEYRVAVFRGWSFAARSATGSTGERPGRLLLSSPEPALRPSSPALGFSRVVEGRIAAPSGQRDSGFSVRDYGITVNSAQLSSTVSTP